MSRHLTELGKMRGKSSNISNPSLGRELTRGSVVSYDVTEQDKWSFLEGKFVLVPPSGSKVLRQQKGGKGRERLPHLI